MNADKTVSPRRGTLMTWAFVAAGVMLVLCAGFSWLMAPAANEPLTARLCAGNEVFVVRFLLGVVLAGDAATFALLVVREWRHLTGRARLIIASMLMLAFGISAWALVDIHVVAQRIDTLCT